MYIFQLLPNLNSEKTSNAVKIKTINKILKSILNALILIIIAKHTITKSVMTEK